MTRLPRGQTPERQAYMKAYRALHGKRDRRVYKAAYDKTHREENKAYRLRNAVALKIKHAAYYQKHRDRLLAAVKARSLSQAEKISRYHAEHYAKNAARLKAAVSAYRKANPDKKRHLENCRRARKAGNGGTHTLEERQAKFSTCGNVCYYCGRAGRLTVDHMIPLKRGGTNDIANIVPACRSCNSRKHTRTAEEYFSRKTLNA